MKVLKREEFLLSKGSGDQQTIMLCVKLLPLALLADISPEAAIQELKEEVVYRGSLAFRNSIACWSECTLFIWLAGGVEDHTQISEDCQAFAELIQERYTVSGEVNSSPVSSKLVRGRHRHHLRAVIGATVCEGDQPVKGLRHAEKAAEQALKDIGHPVVWYEEEIEEVHGNSRISAGVIQMLNEGSFRLVYQPQVSMACGTLKGLEVLIRAPDDPEHPLFGLSPPDLIKGVSDLNLLTDLTIQIIQRVMRSYFGWRNTCPNLNLNMSVNVTPNTLLLGWRALLDALPSDVSLSWLTLEIIEIQEFLMGSHGDLAAVVRRIRNRGIGVSIDDFGKGLSNFDRISQIPCDEIKLDRSLIARVAHQQLDSDLVQNMIGIANKNGIRIVAEGIETPAQWNLLKATGCHVGQGFFISEAKPEKVISNQLRALGRINGDWFALPRPAGDSL